MALPGGLDPACWLPLQLLGLCQAAFRKIRYILWVPFLGSMSSKPALGQDTDPSAWSLLKILYWQVHFRQAVQTIYFSSLSRSMGLK